MAEKLDMQSLVKKVQSSFKSERLQAKVGTGGVLRTLHEDDFIKLGPWWQDSTGLKGIPKGRITLIGGTEDSGKCLSLEQFDNLVYSEKGICSFKDAFDSKSSTIGEKEVEYWYLDSEKRKVFSVYFEDDSQVTGTQEHRLRVLHHDGSFVWKKLTEIKKGDYVVSTPPPKSIFYNKLDVNPTLSFFVGLLYSCGSLKNSYVDFSFASPLQLKYVRTCLKELDIPLYNNFSFNISYLTSLIPTGKENLTFDLNNPDLSIPGFVLKGNLSTIYSFFEGLFLDSLTIKEQNHLIQIIFNRYISSINYTYLCFLFNLLGIYPFSDFTSYDRRLAFKNHQNNLADIVSLLHEDDPTRKLLQTKELSKNSLYRPLPYLKEIIILHLDTFNDEDRKKYWSKLQEYFKHSNNEIQSWLKLREEIPAFCDGIAKNIENIISTNFKIVINKDDLSIGLYQQVADPHIALDNTYFVSGVDSHNTSFAIQSIKAAMEQGMGVIYAESEGKTTEKDFIDWGVDPTQVLFVQSAIAEELFELTFAAWNAFKNQYPDIPLLVVIDSLGNVISQRDSEIDLTEQNSMPGGKGKVNRLGLNKMIAKANEDNTTLLLISYTYDNLGSVGQTIAGGRSLALLSALTYQTQKKKFLEKQVQGRKIRYGAEVLWKLRKNHIDKTAPMEKELLFQITKDGIEHVKVKEKTKEKVVVEEDVDDNNSE